MKVRSVFIFGGDWDDVGGMNSSQPPLEGE